MQAPLARVGERAWDEVGRLAAGLHNAPRGLGASGRGVRGRVGDETGIILLLHSSFQDSISCRSSKGRGAHVVKLVDTPYLGYGATAAWRFESSREQGAFVVQWKDASFGSGRRRFDSVRGQGEIKRPGASAQADGEPVSRLFDVEE